jgi:phosphoribosylanthranilate isomerase
MVKVKVCGITNPRDASVATDAGADAVGLIFAESPRRIDVEQARKIAAALPNGILKDPETVAKIRKGGLGVIKALRVRNAQALAAVESYEADLFLLDAWSAKLRGGTGERFDWELAKALKWRDNILVSGGLTPENVREAIEFFEPYGVDASSSLEERPGKKDDERVRRFVGAAKG